VCAFFFRGSSPYVSCSWVSRSIYIPLVLAIVFGLNFKVLF